LVDNHFNPTIGKSDFVHACRETCIPVACARGTSLLAFFAAATQAVFRAYRYGQEKEVFCYRLLTQGTVEEKVYGRCVTKTGVALRVIDKKSIERSFTSRELQDLMQTFTWVQCEDCQKWRVLIGETSDEDLPEKWYCHMNDTDPINNKCDAIEKEQLWYEKFVREDLAGNVTQSPLKVARDSARSSRVPEQSHNDPLLQHLTEITEENKSTTLVCQHYFHDALLETTDDSEELERVEREISERAEEEKKNAAEPINNGTNAPLVPDKMAGTIFFLLTFLCHSIVFISSSRSRWKLPLRGRGTARQRGFNDKQ